MYIQCIYIGVSYDRQHDLEATAVGGPGLCWHPGWSAAGNQRPARGIYFRSMPGGAARRRPANPGMCGSIEPRRVLPLHWYADMQELIRLRWPIRLLIAIVLFLSGLAI